jgi:hypothetical protein
LPTIYVLRQFGPRSSERACRSAVAKRAAAHVPPSVRGDKNATTSAVWAHRRTGGVRPYREPTRPHHQLLRRAEFSVRCVPVPFLAETEKKTRPRASEGWGRPAERARLRPTLLQPASSKCARDFLSDTRTHRHSISPPAARIIARSLASLCSPAFRCPRTH